MAQRKTETGEKKFMVNYSDFDCHGRHVKSGNEWMTEAQIQNVKKIGEREFDSGYIVERQFGNEIGSREYFVA